MDLIKGHPCTEFALLPNNIRNEIKEGIKYGTTLREEVRKAMKEANNKGDIKLSEKKQEKINKTIKTELQEVKDKDSKINGAVQSHKRTKSHNYYIALVIVLFLFIFCAIIYFNHIKTTTPTFLNCTDGTENAKCSLNKPYYCSNGTMTYSPSICGCSKGYRIYEGNCIKEILCSDGTLDPECSYDKPYKCVKGNLIFKASECGCPKGYKILKERCVK